MRKLIKATVVASLFATSLSAQNEPDSIKSVNNNPFSFEGSYTGDFFANMAGGIKEGVGHLGMGNLKMGFDTEKARFWKGGSFFINGAAIYGDSPTENFVGDLQVVSNIDGGTHIYLHEAWFRQQVANFEFTIGLQDLNADFMATENGGEFINSSFGVPPVVANNIPVPIFPLTGLGITAKWNINDLFTWQAAIFDGNQTPFEDNPHNVKWEICADDGFLAATELHFKTKIKELDGTYKAGVYYHSGWDDPESDEEENPENYGFYIIADQDIMRNESRNKRLSLFTQIALSPKDVNTHNFYWGLGVNYFGVFSKEGKDNLGFAIASVGLHKSRHKHETALEAYYKIQLTENIAVQPDLQYVINPSGTDEDLDNAFIGFLRLHINF